jgi:hypothetical protein
MYKCKMRDYWTIILQGIPDISVTSIDDPYLFIALGEVYIIFHSREDVYTTTSDLGVSYLPVARWLTSVVNHNDVRKTAQLDLKLLTLALARSVSPSTTVYEGIPEGRLHGMMQKLSTTQTMRHYVACKNANVSAGWCWSIHANRGVVRAYHLCLGPFVSNTS